MHNKSLRLLLLFLSTLLLIAVPLGAQSVLPACQHPPQAEQVLVHEGFTVSYNNKTRCPNWVAWELTPEEAASEVTSRTDVYATDPLVEGKQADNDDYSRNSFGMDRGHMAPSADFRWSVTANEQTFYLTNICPQAHNLNEGPWLELEQRCRAYAKRYRTNVQIVCGPVYEKNGWHRTMGGNGVKIPNAFFKAVLMEVRGKTYAIAFIMENEGKILRENISDYVVTMDELRDKTGIDPFPGKNYIETGWDNPWVIPWKKAKKK